MTSCVVALVQFGKDSTKRLSRVLNRMNIDNRIVLPNERPSFLYSHIILSGGPKHVYEEDHYPMPEWVMVSKAPVLGVCYGMQLIAKTFDGNVVRMNQEERGPIEVTEIIDGHQLTNIRWMNRFDNVVALPSNFTIIGVTSKNCIASFTDYRRWWAVQYHPEAKKHGDLNILRRFLGIKIGKKCPSL